MDIKVVFTFTFYNFHIDVLSFIDQPVNQLREFYHLTIKLVSISLFFFSFNLKYSKAEKS